MDPQVLPTPAAASAILWPHQGAIQDSRVQHRQACDRSAPHHVSALPIFKHRLNNNPNFHDGPRLVPKTSTYQINHQLLPTPSWVW